MIEAKWQSIEAKEQAFDRKEQAIEIGFHFVGEKESIGSTRDYFSSTIEHFVSTKVSTSSIECTF